MLLVLPLHGRATYDRSGQPSVPLRLRGLIGEINDQAWFSSLASPGRCYAREQDGRGRRTETAMSGIAVASFFHTSQPLLRLA